MASLLTNERLAELAEQSRAWNDEIRSALGELLERRNAESELFFVRYQLLGRTHVARISALQLRLGPMPVNPRTRIDLLRVARWWHLESLRGYPSAERSRQYRDQLRAKAWSI